MNEKFVIYFLLNLIINNINCQTNVSSTIRTTTTTTTSNPTTTLNIPCQSNYEPFYNGTCMPNSACLGATIVTNNCKSLKFVCCIEDKNLITENGENAIVKLQSYLKILGDTQRNRRHYYLFKRSITKAGINTCHQAAAYLAQMRGESDNLSLFEEQFAINAPNIDFETSIGNNNTGDGTKYRGRGALLLRGRGVYQNASSLINNYNILLHPEAVAFPTVAFEIASWIWSKNAFVITNNSTAKRGSLNLLADGTYHNFTLLTHAFTSNVNNLKVRSKYYEEIVDELKCKTIKRGRGIDCREDPRGYAVPICLIDFKRSYCGCEGEFSYDICSYGYNNAGQCRNPATIKCCYEKCDASLDLVIIMDSSGSIGKDDYMKGLNFIKKLINDLDVGENKTRVSLINYSTNATIITFLNEIYDKGKLINKVLTMPYEAGWTNTSGALRQANDFVLKEENGMRSVEQGVSKVVIVITDGASNRDEHLTIPYANRIKARGFSLISVGIGKEINQTELNLMASNKDDVYNVDNYDKVFDIVESLLKTACEQPAKVVVEQPIQGRVNRNSYRYYKLTFDNETTNFTEKEFSIRITNKIGSSKFLYSFDEENPKDENDFIESSSDNQFSNNITGNYIEIKNIQRSNQTVSETTYQIKRPDDKDIMYMSIKGTEDINEFQIYIFNRLLPLSGQISIYNTIGLINLIILLLIITFINIF